jgi:hypothetical protein
MGRRGGTSLRNLSDCRRGAEEHAEQGEK